MPTACITDVKASSIDWWRTISVTATSGPENANERTWATSSPSAWMKSKKNCARAATLPLTSQSVPRLARNVAHRAFALPEKIGRASLLWIVRRAEPRDRGAECGEVESIEEALGEERGLREESDRIDVRVGRGGVEIANEGGPIVGEQDGRERGLRDRRCDCGLCEIVPRRRARAAEIAREREIESLAFGVAAREQPSQARVHGLAIRVPRRLERREDVERVAWNDAETGTARDR